MNEKSPDTHRQPPVGIDLGTTYSVVAYIDGSGRPSTVPNSHGDLLTPSAVAVDAGSLIVGKEAIKIAPLTPDAVATCFKRDIGQAYLQRPLAQKDVPPEVLSALVLERLKADAERKLGRIQQAVITVPAFFDEGRRRATQEAGRLAGLEVLDIINEPTAAAIAYGRERALLETGRHGRTEKVLVYDLGGGTFDVTVLQIDGTTYRTLATDGDVELGGRDFDERLLSHVAEQFVAAHGIDPRSDPGDAAQLLADVQDAKHSLSERTRTTLVCSHAGIRMRLEITRTEFEDLIRDVVERTGTTATQVVRDAAVTWDQIDQVLLVGGSSRLPMVVDLLRKISGREPNRSLSADEAVAHGAAIYAQMLMEQDAGDQSGAERLINVNSHSLGVVGVHPKTKRKVNVVLIPRNTPLPYRVTKSFQTAHADQRSIKVTILEGESSEPKYCMNLGFCVIPNLPPNLPTRTKIEVEYAYASNGRLSVYARVPSARLSAHAEIHRDGLVPGGDLATWTSRLCGSPQAGAGEDGHTSNADASAQSQLDKLYAQLGQLAMRLTVSPALEASKQLAIASQQELTTATAQLDRQSRGSSAVATTTTVAELRQRVAHAETKAHFLRLALGRECVNLDFCPAGGERYWEQIRELRGTQRA